MYRQNRDVYALTVSACEPFCVSLALSLCMHVWWMSSRRFLCSAALVRCLLRITPVERLLSVARKYDL